MGPLRSTPRSRRYRRRRLALTLAHLALVLGGLCVLAFTPLGRGVEAWALRWAPGPRTGFLLFVLLLGLAWNLLGLPLDVAAYRLERAAGLTRTGPLRRAWESLKARLLGAAIGLPLLLAFYLCLRRWPRAWWVPVGGILFAAGVLLAHAGHTLLLPLFLKVGPLGDEALAAALRRMCEAEALPVQDIRRVDLSRLSLKANAAFAGMGPSRRILLADTLLDHFEREEVEAVVAHELGHRRLRHIPRGIALGFAVTVAGLALSAWVHGLLLAALGHESPDRLAALPLLALLLSLYGLLAMPLQNAVMRRWEYQADRFAAARTSPAAMTAALTRLGHRNLADPRPPRLEEILLHDHPSLERRIAALAAAPGDPTS